MPDAYRPDLPTFCDILRHYSRHGLIYFKELSDDMQRNIRLKLGGSIEDNDHEIDRKLASIKNGQQPGLKFLPMPRPGGKDFRASFFLPRIHVDNDDNYTCSFLIIFWVEREGGKTIAIRLEPPMRLESTEEDADAHRYTHLQLTIAVKGPNIVTDFADWTPKSYPAFPLGYSHPLQMFVGMAIAAHGYSASSKKEYLRRAISDSMAEGNAALIAQKIFVELKRTFG